MMKQVVLTGIMMALAGLTLPHTAAAQYVSAQQDTKAGPGEILQRPQKVLVAYDFDADKNLTLKLSALPTFTACGKVSALPLFVSYDDYAVDVTIKDFLFKRPTGMKPYDCGPAIKGAASRVTIPAPLMEQYKVVHVRLWYKGTLDTYTLTADAKGSQILTPPQTVKLFAVDTRAITPSTALTPEPIGSETKKPALPEKALHLNLGGLPIPADMIEKVKALAADRGLMATETPDVFTDAGGQFHFQLQFAKDVPIGRVTMPDGQSAQVMATRPE